MLKKINSETNISKKKILKKCPQNNSRIKRSKKKLQQNISEVKKSEKKIWKIWKKKIFREKVVGKKFWEKAAPGAAIFLGYDWSGKP